MTVNEHSLAIHVYNCTVFYFKTVVDVSVAVTAYTISYVLF